MAKQKPYRDGAQCKRLMTENATEVLQALSVASGGRACAPPDPLRAELCDFLAFQMPEFAPPPGRQYRPNILWVMSIDFNRTYSELESLLFDKIPEAKKPATKSQRQRQAAELSVKLWRNSHVFVDPSDPDYIGMPILEPIPAPPSPPSEQERALRRASIEATWRRGAERTQDAVL